MGDDCGRVSIEGVFSQLPHRVVHAPPRLPTFAAEKQDARCNRAALFPV